MIRKCRLTLASLNLWLVDQSIAVKKGKYRLRVWREDRTEFHKLKDEVVAYFDEALDDARKRIRRGFEDDLSPFNGPGSDPAANFPSMLHYVTLQGYFGETIGAVAAEHWGAHGHNDWVVPAFLFRAHEVEFQHLESINERLLNGEPFNPDASAEKRPGRTGDDSLAFRLDGTAGITDVLTIEAKCLAQNQKAKIEDAHAKLSSAGKVPSGIRELINLLEEYDTTEAKKWQQELLTIWRNRLQDVSRHDAVTYVCGTAPVNTKSWLPVDKPDASYTARRKLEGMEFHCPDLIGLIELVYEAHNMANSATIEIAQGIREHLAGESLTAGQAKLYSQRLRRDMGQAGLPSFTANDVGSQLDDALLLLTTSLLERKADPNSPWRGGVKRAAEILEWLCQPSLKPENEPIELLSAAAYQLADYPAMALGILKRIPDNQPVSIIMREFLRANFPATLAAVREFWRVQRALRLADNVEPEDITSHTYQHVVMCIGTICAFLRSGNNSMAERALSKLEKLAAGMLHSRDPYSYLLATMTAAASGPIRRSMLLATP